MILHLFDVKQMMYIGQSKKETVTRGIIEDGGPYSPNKMNVGAICYLFEYVNKLRNDPNNIICMCCDSPPTYKRDLLMDVFGMVYKGGRPKTPDTVKNQYLFAIELLRQMNFHVYKESSYEADDLIASIVRKYKSVFDQVVIHSNDSDQHYLIEPHVMCESVSSYCKSVTYSSYERDCSKKRPTPYNRVMLYKMVYGEPGDNVPELAYNVNDLIFKCVPHVTDKHLGDPVLLRTIIKAISQNEKRAMATCDAILPRLIYDERVSIDFSKKPDWNLFKFYATAFHSSSYRGFTLENNELGESTILNELERLNG